LKVEKEKKTTNGDQRTNSMTSTIGQNIEALCSEHGLDRNLIIEAMKDAVKAAARKQFRNYDKTGEGIEVDWNDEEGIVEFRRKKPSSRKSKIPRLNFLLTKPSN
jgi:hypothetical protein